MIKLNGGVTDRSGFFENADPLELIKQFGSPLYVYNERILRKKCRELKNMCAYKLFAVNYSVKANSNLSLLKIIRSEHLRADAFSAGEIFIERKAGFSADEIIFVANNVSDEELRYAIDQNIIVSVDSLSQLARFGRLNPGGRVVIRLNMGIGAGHHEKVVTAGHNTKFGINPEYLDEVRGIISKYQLKLVGVNQHIGSLFLQDDAYIKSALELLSIAETFELLEFVDLGGGFGIPYHKQSGQARPDLRNMGVKMDAFMRDFSKRMGKDILFLIEPGRYIAAECGVLLGTVHTVKNNGPTKYIGTDIGMNVLARPSLYDAHHDIEIYRAGSVSPQKEEKVTVVGNICESGDILAKERILPAICEQDIVGVLDAGAYGHVMSSNYNSRLRTAEILLRENGAVELIRRRDTFEDLLRAFPNDVSV